MATYDLITRMGQYLDRHLVFPLLEFLSVKQVDYLSYFNILNLLNATTLRWRLWRLPFVRASRHFTGAGPFTGSLDRGLTKYRIITATTIRTIIIMC